MKQERKKKLSTRYDPDAYAVVGTKGTSLLLMRRAEPEIMRNSLAVRKFLQNNNGIEMHLHEADKEPDQIIQATGDSRFQRP